MLLICYFYFRNHIGKISCSQVNLLFELRHQSAAKAEVYTILLKSYLQKQVQDKTEWNNHKIK